MDRVSFLNIGGTDYEIADSTARNELELKADKTALSGVASGSPAGVYDNLSLLQGAEEADKTRIYLTLDNGNWNYWNGSSWVSGGVYQATNITDASITERKTTFFNNVGNLFLGDIKSGYAFSDDGETVTEVVQERKYITDFIEVEPSTKYFAYTLYAVFYTKDKTIISFDKFSASYNNSKYIVTPSNCKYIKLSAVDDTIVKLIKVGTYGISNSLYKLKTDYIDIVDGSLLKTDSINSSKVNFIEQVGNLFYKETVTFGYNIDSEGGFSPATNYAISDFIKVEPTKRYILFALNTCMYDSNLNLVKCVGQNSDEVEKISTNIYVITIPEDVEYIRFGMSTGKDNNISAYYVVNLDYPITVDNKIKGNVVQHSNCLNIEGNLVDLDTFTKGVGFGKIGDYLAIYANGKYMISDFIEVMENHTYNLFAFYVAVFDKDYKLIYYKQADGTGDVHNFNVTIPENGKYLKFDTLVRNKTDMIWCVDITDTTKETIRTLNGTLDYSNFLDKTPSMPRFREATNYNSQFGNQCYFLGRWEYLTIDSKKLVYTGYTGARIFTKLKNATSATFSFYSKSAYRLAYRVNDGEYTLLSNPTTIYVSGLNPSIDNYIEICITDLDFNTWTNNLGVGFDKVITDGTAVAVAPMGKVALVYGDSIAQGYGVEENRTQAHLNFVSKMCEYLRCSAVTIGEGGIGYAHKANSDFITVKGTEGFDDTTYTATGSYIDYMRQGVKEQSQYPDFIILELGTNDFPSTEQTTNYVTIVKNVVNRIENKYPGVPIFGLIPLNGRNKSSLIEAYNSCNNVTTIDCSKYLNISMYDTLHPNVNGSDIMGKNLSRDLLNYFGKSYFLV